MCLHIKQKNTSTFSLQKGYPYINQTKKKKARQNKIKIESQNSNCDIDNS